MAITVEYELFEQKPRSMAFAIADRRSQSVTIRNGFAHKRAMFKIQSTTSRKFRVRPALAELPPSALVRVSIQLSPQEREPCECKLLVIVREVDDTNARSSDRGNDSECEMKVRWTRAEKREHESLLFSETVDVHVLEVQTRTPLDDADDWKEVHAPTPALAPCSEVNPQLSVYPLNNELESCIQSAAPSTDQQQAEIVVLMMKNQSVQPENRLTEQEVDTLRRLRASCTSEQWQIWQVYAYRMRVLLRERGRRSKWIV